MEHHVQELVQPMRMKPILYSDAEGTGAVAAVLCHPNGKVYFTRSTVPRSLRRQLRFRRTQITFFELYAAAVAVHTFLVPCATAGILYVDNQAVYILISSTHTIDPAHYVLLGCKCVDQAALAQWMHVFETNEYC